MSYQSFRENQTVAPVVQMHLDYRLPLRFDQVVTIETSLHWTRAARLNFSYAILNEDGAACSRGYTVQLLTDEDGSILLMSPDWLEAFQQKWESGAFV